MLGGGFSSSPFVLPSAQVLPHLPPLESSLWFACPLTHLVSGFHRVSAMVAFCLFLPFFFFFSLLCERSVLRGPQTWARQL